MVSKLLNSKSPIVVVIGGGNGIGAATSILMSERGWYVVVADIEKLSADKVVNEINGFSSFVDITNEKSVEKLSDVIEKKVGPVSALVVAAAKFQDIIPSERLEIKLWESIFKVNLTGTFISNRVFARKMIERKFGSIVNIASIASLGSMPVESYGTSKAGVVHLSKNLAGEWGRSGIRVNAVSPGSTLVERVKKRLKSNRYSNHPSKFTALGKMVEPKEVAEVIEFLCSSRSSGVTGINMVVDAGWEVASSWAQFGGVRDDY